MQTQLCIKSFVHSYAPAERASDQSLPSPSLLSHIRFQKDVSVCLGQAPCMHAGALGE